MIKRNTLFAAAATLAGVVLLGLLSPRALKAITGAPVTVVNGLSAWIPVRDTDQPARTPFLARFNASATMATVLPLDIYGPVIPANKRLVIEEVSANCSSAIGVEAIAIYGNINGLEVPFYLNRLHAEAPSYYSATYLELFTSSLRTYVDPGQKVHVGVFDEGRQQQYAGCGVNVSGYLVDLGTQQVFGQ